MNRSNINLVGNTTQGQNLGDGACIFKTKALGNLLQFRSISSTGDSIQIYEVDNKILISGASGGGSSISGTPTYVSKFNSTGDNIEDSAIIDSGTTNMHLLKTCIITGRSIDTGVTIKAHDHPTSGVDLYLKPGCRLDYESGHQDGYLYLDPGRGVPYHAIYLGSPIYDKPNVFLQPYGTSTNMGLYIRGKGTSGIVSILGGSSAISNFGVDQTYINICDGGNLFMGTYNDFIIKGASTSSTDSHGKNLCIVGGDGTGDGSSSGGTVIIRSGIGTVNDGRIRIDNLPLQSTETDVVYIDGSGNLSCGAGGGGGDSYWSSGATGLYPSNNEKIITGTFQVTGGTLTSGYVLTSDASGNATWQSGGISTATNGVSVDGNNFVLGGTLTGDTTINTGTYRLCFGVSNTIYRMLSSGAGGGYIYQETLSTSGANSYCTQFANITSSSSGGIISCVENTTSKENHQLRVYDDAILIEAFSGNTKCTCLEMTTGTTTHYDNANSKGIVYGGDYENQFTNRSLVTKNYVDTCVGGIEGGTTPGGSNTHVQYNNSGSFAGSSGFTFDGTNVDVVGSVCASDFELTSDERCKTNISEYIPFSSNIQYKQFELCNCVEQTRYGVIAQEVQNIYPEVVRTNDEGYLSISYIDLLIREVAYLKNKVEELENKIK